MRLLGGQPDAATQEIEELYPALSLGVLRYVQIMALLGGIVMGGALTNCSKRRRATP